MTETTTPPIVFLDTETDGVHPTRKVWEVGMIRREPDGTEKEAGFFVDIDLSTADPFGLKVGRFYDRHPLGKSLASPEKAEKLGLIAGFRSASTMRAPYIAALTVAQWTHGAIVVGAVPNFDAEVLGNLLRAEGLTPAWHYHLVDVETLAAGALKLTPPWSFDKVLAAYGLTYDEADRHTALGDARMAQRLYDAVLTGAAAESAVA
jgi:hypothetical protein